MSTPAQIAANQANAQKSTGPKSETGKAASSQNNLRHGFTAAFQLLPAEDPAEYEHLLFNLTVDHQPTNATEHILVERMAQAQWLVGRALHLQSLCLIDDHKDAERSFALYIRYQTTNERAFTRCLNDLLKLRSEKRKEKIGFESQELKKAEHARKQNIENRKQDSHKWEVWHAQLKAEHQQMTNLRFEALELNVQARPQAA